MTSTGFSRRSEPMRRGLLIVALLLGLGRPLMAAEAPPVGVRGWDHGDYGRLVFDLTAGIDGQATIEGQELVISFSAPVRLDAAPALRRLARLAGEVTMGADGKSLRIALKTPVTLVPQRYQDKLVLDLKPASPDKPSANPPPASSAPSKPEAPKPEAPKPEASKPEAPKPEPAVAPKPEAPKPVASAEAVPAVPPPPALPASPAPEAQSHPVAEPRPAPQSHGAAVPPPSATTPAPPPAPPAQAHGAPVATPVAASPPAPTRGAAVTLRRELAGSAVELVFDAPAAAAIFARGDALWFVFDRAGADAGHMAGSPIADLGSVLPLDVPGGSGFRLSGPAVPPQVSGDGTRWRFLFAPAVQPPATPLVASPGADAEGRMRLVARIPGIRPPVQVPDPEIGDRLTVVPVGQPGAGVVVGARLPELELLPTVQGLVFSSLSDDVTASVEGDDLVIGRAGGSLTLSDVVPAPSSVPRALGEKIEGGLDVGAWAVPGEVEPNRSRMEREAALAAATAKTERRLALGRFLVANGYGAEAIGVAEILAKDDPPVAETPAFRLMRGIALAMQERHGDALADLKVPALEFASDAALWRGYALASTGAKREAYKAFGAGMSAITHYPPRYQERLLAAIGDAALAADDVRAASEAAASLSSRATTNAGKARALALEGRVAVRRSDAVAARAAFEAALATGERVARVDAEMGLIELGLADGSLSRGDAIARLDRLRYVWRGDEKELAVLRRLADLQLAEGQWRDGLQTLRLAEKLFPKDPGVDALKDTERAAFRRLFLGGAADALPPVQAVALYFDFRDLTPLGPDGDDMIRKLSDRLVQVDLLDQAKTLLSHQVENRLQGIPRSRVAARLALLHLLDREPAKAMQVLDATEQPVLPETTARLRRLLRARALADLGRPADARSLLAADTSIEAARLGAEITWQARDWGGAALYLGRLLDGRTPPEHGAPGPDEESLVLRLSVARTLTADAAGLKQLASLWGPAMAQSKSAEAFAMLTGNADPSAIVTRNLAQTMANTGVGGNFLGELRTRLASGEGLGD